MLCVFFMIKRLILLWCGAYNFTEIFQSCCYNTFCYLLLHWWWDKSNPFTWSQKSRNYLLILIPGRRDVSKSTLFLNVGGGTYFPLGRWRSNGVPVLFGITIPLCFAFVGSETSSRLTSASTSMIFAWLPLPTFFGYLPWLPLATFFSCMPHVLCVMFFGCTSCTTWCKLEACCWLWMDLKNYQASGDSVAFVLSVMTREINPNSPQW